MCRNHLPPQKRSTVNRDVVRYPGPATRQTQRGGRAVRQSADPVALKKITALESELLQLRAQIAMIVTAAPASGARSLILVPRLITIILRTSNVRFGFQPLDVF